MSGSMCFQIGWPQIFTVAVMAAYVIFIVFITVDWLRLQRKFRRLQASSMLPTEEEAP